MIPNFPNYQGKELIEICKRLVQENIEFKMYVNNGTNTTHFIIDTINGYIDITPYSTLNNNGELVHFGLDIEFANYNRNHFYQGYDIDTAMLLIKEYIIKGKIPDEYKSICCL